MSAKVPTLQDKLTLDEFLAMPVDQREDLAKSYGRTIRRLDEAKEENSDATKRAGVMLCGFAIQLEEAKKMNLERQDMTLKEFANNRLSKGERKKLVFPNAAYTFKVVVGAYVKNGFVTYEQYYNCSTRALDYAGQIVKALEAGNVNVMESESFKAAVKELAPFSDKSAKNLKAILDTIKPAEAMDIEQMVKLLDKINAAGLRDDAIAHIAELIGDDANPANQAASFTVLMRAVDALNAKIPEEISENAAEKAELAARLSSTAPVQIIREEVQTAEAVAA